jgi:hypothetical protein
VLDKLRSTDFLPYLNQKFWIRLDGIAPIDLELVEVMELGAAHRPEYRRPFSLMFLGPVSQQYLLQATYQLEHAQMGALDLFIVPLGPQQGRMRYQAIFS